MIAVRTVVPGEAFPHDLDGPAARAWLLPLEEGRAAVRAWIVRFPGAHAFWDRWLVTSVHLRDVPGLDAPYLAFAGATHEIEIIALNPEYYREDPRALRGICHLLPLDCVRQVGGLADQQAAQIVDLVRGMCQGWSPDADYRTSWIERIDETAACIRAGRHPAA